MSSTKGIQKHKYRLVRMGGETKSQDAGFVVIKFNPFEFVKSKTTRTVNPNGVVRLAVKLFMDSELGRTLGERTIWEHQGDGKSGCFGDRVEFEPIP